MDRIINIDGIVITDLKKIAHPKGDIFHIIRKGDDGYIDFGELYSSSVNFKEIKAWKKHFIMTCNIVVGYGIVKIVLIDKRKESKTFNKIDEFILSKEDYFRLSIPPGLWYGFEGLSAKNLILNFADIIHDSEEQINIDYKTSKFNYKW